LGTKTPRRPDCPGPGFAPLPLSRPFPPVPAIEPFLTPQERERREELEAAAPRAALACTTATAAMTPSQRRDAIEARAVAAELAAQKAERQAAARDRAARVDAARTQRALAVVHRGRALARAGLRGLAVAVSASARRAHEAERYRLLALLRGWHRAAAQEAEDDTVNVGAFTRHRRARAGLLGLWRAAALARHADDVLARRAFLGLAEAAGDARDRLTAARGHHARRALRSALRAWGAHASEEASARRVVEAAGEAAVLRLRRVHALRRGLRGWVEGAALEAETRVENRHREERWGRLDGWLQEIRSGGSEKGATVAATKAADRLMLDFDAALGPVPHPEDLARGEGGR